MNISDVNVYKVEIVETLRREVTVAAAGKTVASGGVLDAETRNRDVAAIALGAALIVWCIISGRKAKQTPVTP